MGHRLSKITTRTGDKGMTGLATGVRVEKDSPRVFAMIQGSSFGQGPFHFSSSDETVISREMRS